VVLNEEFAMSAVELVPAPQPSAGALSLLPFRKPHPEALAPRYERLAHLSRSIASMTLDALSRNLAGLLRPLLPFDLVNIVVFDQVGKDARKRSLGAAQLAPLEIPIEETTIWSVHQEQKPLWVADWQEDERPEVQKEALNPASAGYRSLCRLPLCSAAGCLGVISFASHRSCNFSEQEVQLLLLAADQVALGLANKLSLEAQQRTQQELDKTSARLELIADLNGLLKGMTALDLSLTQFTARIRQLMASDFAILGLWNFDDERFEVKAFDAMHGVVSNEESTESLGTVLWEHALHADRHWIGRLEDLSHDRAMLPEWIRATSMPCCVLPLVVPGRVLGVLAVGARGDFSRVQEELEYLGLISSLITLAVTNSHAQSELRRLKQEIGEGESFGMGESCNGPIFEEIVGRSQSLQRVLQQAEVVAPTDSSVLIQGETGTGKELMARAIHNRSGRRDRPFIKINCAAIPSGLLESELFGHEKGAFTGAIIRKPGRFELADKGTLFLDEVGDIPLDLQSKLLRVLQEKEFERLGSTRTQQVDVRVIAATHRNLKQMIEEGTFRSDLYYRLHVFPLTIPSLRDRREDIPLIVRHYVEDYAQRMNRQIDTIPARTMEVLTNYSWPGNVRELQNFIERAVILSPGSCLRPPLEELEDSAAQESRTKLSTLEEMEREHVLRALRESNWVTGGPNGAAVRLGIKRTTLAYRIRKLKIPCRPQ